MAVLKLIPLPGSSTLVNFREFYISPILSTLHSTVYTVKLSVIVITTGVVYIPYVTIVVNLVESIQTLQGISLDLLR